MLFCHFATSGSTVRSFEENMRLSFFIRKLEKTIMVSQGCCVYHAIRHERKGPGPSQLPRQGNQQRHNKVTDKGRRKTYFYWGINCVWRGFLMHTQGGRWMDGWTAVDARFQKTSQRWEIPDMPWAKFTYSFFLRPNNCLWHSSVSFDKCIQLYNHHHTPGMERFHQTPNLLLLHETHSLPPQLALPADQQTTNLFFVPTVSPLLQCHINGIMHDESLSLMSCTWYSAFPIHLY